jgi:hypothetical protein
MHPSRLWWWAYKVEQYEDSGGGEMICEEVCFEDKWEGLGLGFKTGRSSKY